MDKINHPWIATFGIKEYTNINDLPDRGVCCLTFIKNN